MRERCVRTKWILRAHSCKIPFSNSPHPRVPHQKLAGSPADPRASAQKQCLEFRRRLTPAPTKATGHGRSLRAGGATDLCWPASTKPIDVLTRGARLFCAHVAQRDGRQPSPANARNLDVSGHSTRAKTARENHLCRMDAAQCVERKQGLEALFQRPCVDSRGQQVTADAVTCCQLRRAQQQNVASECPRAWQLGRHLPPPSSLSSPSKQPATPKGEAEHAPIHAVPATALHATPAIRSTGDTVVEMEEASKRG